MLSETNNQVSIDTTIIKKKLSELNLIESNPSKIDEIILDLKNIWLKYYPTKINEILNIIIEYLIKQPSNNREKILTILQDHTYLSSDITNFLENIRNAIQSYDLQSKPQEDKSLDEISDLASISSFDELTEEDKETKGFLISPEIPSEKLIPSTIESQPISAPEKVLKTKVETDASLRSNEEATTRTTLEPPPPPKSANTKIASESPIGYSAPAPTPATTPETTN